METYLSSRIEYKIITLYTNIYFVILEYYRYCKLGNNICRTCLSGECGDFILQKIEGAEWDRLNADHQGGAGWRSRSGRKLGRKKAQVTEDLDKGRNENFSSHGL